MIERLIKMKTRIIHTKYWKDPFVRSLTIIQSHLYLYLLTNEHVNIIHCYECPDDLISFETKIDMRDIVETKNLLERNKKVSFFDSYVFLNNSHKYEKFVGEKNETAKNKLIEEMSDKVRKWYESKYTPIDTPIHRDYKTETINNKSENKNHKTEIRGIEELRSKIKTL